MAWLKGLAGKAEDFLNQIDQSAAVVLTPQMEKKEYSDSQLTEVTWDRQVREPMPQNVPLSQPSAAQTNHINGFSPQSSISSSGLNSVRSSPNLSSFVPIRNTSKSKNDELMSFLNNSSVSEPVQLKPLAESRGDLNSISTPGVPFNDSRKSSPVEVDVINENMSRSTSSETSKSSARTESNDKEPSEMSPTQTKIDKEADDLRNENGLLKSELRSFNNEMSLLLQRAKAAEKECINLQQQLTKLHASKTEMTLSLKDKHDLVVRLELQLQVARQEVTTAMQFAKKLEIENKRLVQESVNSSDDQNAAVLSCRQELVEKEEEFERVRSAHKQELISVRGVIKSLELEKAALTNDLTKAEFRMNECRKEQTELQEKFEKSRLEVTEVRAEFDQYRARAQRILHDKDKLITELRAERAGPEGSIDDVTAMELEQLRQERELVREEVAQVSARLHATGAELAEAERKLEANREQAVETHNRLQNSLQEEKSLRQAAEEDCRTQTEGLRSVREELSRHRSLLASKVREREMELTKLRSQLTQRPASPPGGELESRLHVLTHTLVQKQASLEALTTERNALRLQMEKLEHKHQEAVAHFYRHQGVNVNDTDDAKARVPSFLEESPLDTGVTRRVKRAYSNLDAVSIRTGVFLRRYPLARILMLSYMVLLHLWVMIVLFTYTPEVHPK